MDNNGCVLSQQEIQRAFNIQRINFLDYYRLKIVIDKFIKEHKTRDSFNFLQPCILNSIRIILSGSKGTKYFYENLNKRHLTLIFKQKWHDDLKVDLKDDIWRQLFRICFKTIQDPYFKWFQYRIMHRILGTHIILHKMGVADSNKCLLCRSTSEETLLHLFFSCPKANQLWHQLENRIFNKTGFYIQFSPEDVLLGYIHHNSNSAAINTLIMVIKCYIYTCSRKGFNISIDGALIKCKTFF